MYTWLSALDHTPLLPETGALPHRPTRTYEITRVRPQPGRSSTQAVAPYQWQHRNCPRTFPSFKKSGLAANNDQVKSQ